MTYEPWKTWGHAPRSSGTFELPPPAMGALTDAARARMNESARFKPDWEHTPCLYALLDQSPDEALRALKGWTSSECQCEIAPALLVHMGERALVPLLRRTSIWPTEMLGMVEDIGTPWAIPRVLEALIGPPRSDTDDSDFRAQHRRARKWIRRFRVEIEPTLRAIAAGKRCAELAEQRKPDLEEGSDPHVTLAHQAKMALGLIDPSERTPILVPLERPNNIGSIRGVDEAPLLARVLWPLAFDPFEDWPAAKRKRTAEHLQKHWLEKFDSDNWVLAGAIALGGASVTEDLARFEWPKDSFKIRSDYRQQTFARVAAEVACGLPSSERDRIFAVLGELASDATKKREHIARGALRGLEAAASLLDAPSDLFDEEYFPRLGFDTTRMRSMAWGSRTLAIKLEPDLSLSFSVDGVKRASPPTPKKGERTDKDAVADLNARARSLARGLEARCTTWLHDGQRWPADDFANVLSHPVLGSACAGFVWATYGPDDRALQTFRIAEDGTYADASDAKLLIAGDARVGLVHPADLDAPLLQRWQGVLADYEIIPLFEQLTPVRALDRRDDLEIRREVAGGLYRFQLKKMRTPRGWSIARGVLGDKHEDEVQTWERPIRSWRVKIEGTREHLVARVRRVGDFRCNWLSWKDAPLPAHEILGDIAEFLAAHSKR